MQVITEQKIKDLLVELAKKYKVFDTRKEGLPPKQYFFPPEEEIFFQNKKGGKIDSPKLSEKFVLFGLDNEDLEAITYLDEIMAKYNEDPFYFQKRNQSTVIGLVEGEQEVMPGGDLVFQKTKKENYRVVAVTDKGKKIIKDCKTFFEESDKKEIKLENHKTGSWEESMGQFILDGETISNAVEWSKDNKIWDELAEKCLGCGICTYVCPICHCFSSEDKIDLTGRCSRCRKWDACTLPGFAKVAGNFNFRPKLKNRYYSWFYHKFVRAYAEYGKPQCVGCGRCKKYCPASIDIQEVLKRIVEEYKAQKNG